MIVIKKRKPHESIAGHMVLNETTLDFIYKHAEDMEQYQNFANLYFASVEIFKQINSAFLMQKMEMIYTRKSNGYKK